MAECLGFLRPDAPHSSLAKLRRDMEYNVLQPIRQHLTNNRNLKSARSHASKRADLYIGLAYMHMRLFNVFASSRKYADAGMFTRRCACARMLGMVLCSS